MTYKTETLERNADITEEPTVGISTSTKNPFGQLKETGAS